jgi:hypothetical protein
VCELKQKSPGIIKAVFSDGGLVGGSCEMRVGDEKKVLSAED